MLKFKIYYCLPLLTLFLTGCAGMFTNEARCPFTEHGSCQSVESVNKMVSHHRFTHDKSFVQDPLTHQKSQDQSNVMHDHQSKDWSGWNSPTPYSGEPMRSPEIDARMWIAPWRDQDNVYHGSSYMNFVVKKSDWSTLPPKAITDNDYDDED